MSVDLSGETTRLAPCVRLLRADGVALGFTMHDELIERWGLDHAPAGGLDLSAITGEMGGAGGFEVRLATRSLGIGGSGEGAESWLRARVRVDVADWGRPGVAVAVAGGTVASVVVAGGEATLTVADALAGRTDDGIVPTSPACRARLGDAACGVDMDGRTWRGPGDWAGGRLRPVGAGALERFVLGRVRVLSGSSAGLEADVRGVDGGVLLLGDGLAVDGMGRVALREGCDRRFATCRDRFANARWFRGEPELPGMDALARGGR